MANEFAGSSSSIVSLIDTTKMVRVVFSAVVLGRFIECYSQYPGPQSSMVLCAGPAVSGRLRASNDDSIESRVAR